MQADEFTTMWNLSAVYLIINPTEVMAEDRLVRVYVLPFTSISVQHTGYIT
jgi:hypothetical protein